MPVTQVACCSVRLKRQYRESRVKEEEAVPIHHVLFQLRYTDDKTTVEGANKSTVSVTTFTMGRAINLAATLSSPMEGVMVAYCPLYRSRNVLAQSIPHLSCSRECGKYGNKDKKKRDRSSMARQGKA